MKVVSNSRNEERSKIKNGLERIQSFSVMIDHTREAQQYSNQSSSRNPIDFLREKLIPHVFQDNSNCTTNRGNQHIPQ